MDETLIFKNKRPIAERLFAYGFQPKNVGLVDAEFTYTKEILSGQFRLCVKISREGRLSTRMIDMASGEDYTLHRNIGAEGAFVGQVRKAYEEILTDIAKECFESDVFKSQQAKELIQWVRQRYGDELEFLWEKFPNDAIWRRKDTKKWYAALLTVSKRKVGQDSDEPTEILDLRIRPEELEDTIDNQRYFPGYHMNKKHWYTIWLNGSVPTEEICRRIEESYALAKK